MNEIFRHAVPPEKRAFPPSSELLQERGDQRRSQTDQGNEGERPSERRRMGNMPDDRRSQQKAQKADRGNGGQSHAGNHLFGLSGHAVAERDNGRGAQPHQKEAQRGGPQHREQNGNQKPGGNQNAARAQHAHGSEAHHHAVRRKTSQGHRAHERYISRLHQARAWLNHTFKIYAAPIEHGPLADHAPERNQSDKQYIGVHAPEHATALGTGMPGVPRQKETGKNGQNEHAYQKNGDEMRFRGHIPVHHEGPQQRAEEPRQAPQAVKAGHDAALVQPLHAHPLRIDGNIRQIGGHTEQKQPSGQFPEGGNQPQAHEYGGVKNGRRHEYPPAAEAAYQVAGQGHGGHLPDGNGKEDGPQIGIVHPQGALDVGNAAGPTGEHQALKKIEGTNRQPVNALGRFGKREIHSGFSGSRKKLSSFAAPGKRNHILYNKI